jgi:predicted transcriptional regulator
LVFLELIDALIVLIDAPLMSDLQIAVSSSNQEVRDRFFPMMSELISMVAVRNSILKHVKKNPNTIQSELAEVLQLDKLEIRRVCWYLDHFDRLVRTKAGSSYRLEIAE